MMSEHDAIMFEAWREVLLNDCGYTVEELHEATTFLSTNPDRLPRSRVENLAAIHTRIRDVRRETFREQRIEAERLAWAQPCRDCSGSGWVRVPHPRSITEEHWVYPWYAVSVVCPNCPKGEKVWLSMGGRSADKRPLRLTDYETLHPYWRELAEEKRQRDARRARAVTISRLAEPEESDSQAALDAVLARLRCRVKVRT